MEGNWWDCHCCCCSGIYIVLQYIRVMSEWVINWLIAQWSATLLQLCELLGDFFLVLSPPHPSFCKYIYSLFDCCVTSFTKKGNLPTARGRIDACACHVSFTHLYQCLGVLDKLLLRLDCFNLLLKSACMQPASKRCPYYIVAHTLLSEC